MNFASYHPALNLLLFVAVVAFTACWTRPGLVAVSFLCALAFSVRLRGPRAVAIGCALALCALAFAALFAMNVHFGVTNLARTPIGNSITIESLTCGVLVGFKVAAILVWLSCVLCVFTADKVVFLLGRVFPKAAMMLAVALRAVPVAGDRARKIAVAQSGIGRGPGQGSILRRIANALRRASILISWSIERFVEMSDSMRSAVRPCAGVRRIRSTASTTATVRLPLSSWRLLPCALQRRRSARRKCFSAPSSWCRRRRLRAWPSLRRFSRCAFCRSRFKWPAKPSMCEERKL